MSDFTKSEILMKRFHIMPFDKGTLIKLDLISHYFSSWLLIFISKNHTIWNKVHIYDFFAGIGKDPIGNFGSSLIILKSIVQHCATIQEKNIMVNVTFNDVKRDNYNRLKYEIGKFLEKCKRQNKLPCCNTCMGINALPFKINIYCEDFQKLFQGLYSRLEDNSDNPSFIFIDQFGIKHITPDIFQKLSNLRRTDLLFFISSSYLRRFKNNKYFQKYLRINNEYFDESLPEHCHRMILKYFNSLLVDKNYYLAPFSIKKGANVYGLVFGSHNPLGLQKFLETAWQLDKNTGEANFNIDHDIIIGDQLSLFEDKNVIKKFEYFENNLLKWLKLLYRTNEEIYIFTLRNGFLPKHTNEILKRVENQLHIIGDPSRKKGAFYISYKNNKEIKIKYNE